MSTNSVQVVTLNSSTQKLELKVDKLDAIFQQEDIKHREIVAISIVGAFRQGKSFMLNFFLRYLNEKYVKKAIDGDWLNGDNGQLDGFLWSGGLTPVTGGIHMWNELFTHDFDDGRKVAIVLVDTQGAFDNQTTIEHYTRIFAQSTLLSSIQIFNLMLKIQENDLQHLQLFAEYGRYVVEAGDSKPFQHLMFLVRDWYYSCTHSYGSEGGSEYLKAYFGGSGSGELKSTRNHIEQCFEDISCYLMPPPGTKVSANQSFAGNLGDIDDDFKKHLNDLIPHLLAPENLIVKRINGRALKSEEFLEYFKNSFNDFSNSNIPPPETIMNANARIRNKWAVQESEKYYSNKMASIDCALGEYANKMVTEHNNAKGMAFALFGTNPLIGSSDMKTGYENELNRFIEEEYQVLRENHNHNISLLKQIMKYHSDKVTLFDSALEQYLQLLKTEHEIAKGKAFVRMQKELLGSPHIIEMFKAELEVRLEINYEAVIQGFQNNERAVGECQQSYSTQLAAFHCNIDEYVELLGLEHEIAKKTEYVLLRVNALEGNKLIIARFKANLEAYFDDELEWFIGLYELSIHAIEDSKLYYSFRMSAIDYNSFEYIRLLESEHDGARIEAIRMLEIKVHQSNPHLIEQFKKRLETLIDEHKQDLIKRYPDTWWKSVQRAFSFLSKGPDSIYILLGMCLSTAVAALFPVKIWLATAGAVRAAAKKIVHRYKDRFNFFNLKRTIQKD